MKSMTWKIAGINFDHMHMGDLLRLAHEHPNAEIVGICDKNPAAMSTAIENFSIPNDRVFSDLDVCLETTQPDLIIICAATGEHADYVEMVAKYDCAILVEKPFASSLRDADRMIAAANGKVMVINWPLAWYPCHVTAKRLIDEGLIGRVNEIHYYDGNRGPLNHLADKNERAPTADEKAETWWYKKASGGGSLLDYLGYGVTLGTWFLGGRAPEEVTTTISGSDRLEVDEHSITTARYGDHMSKYETRWGTFTDPWTNQPQPKCGFVIVGSEGTISSYDYEDHISVQTRSQPASTQVPVDIAEYPRRNPMEYVLHCLETGEEIEGPLNPELCRIGQQIVDTAQLSARERRTLELLK